MTGSGTVSKAGATLERALPLFFKGWSAENRSRFTLFEAHQPGPFGAIWIAVAKLLVRLRYLGLLGYALEWLLEVRDTSVIPEEPEVVSSGDSFDSDAGPTQFIHIEYNDNHQSASCPAQDRRQLKDCGPSIQWEDQEFHCIGSGLCG
eukprot:Skav232306  [mRNA]  locus=scaffold882:552408:559782:- [translate_table: standard]